MELGYTVNRKGAGHYYFASLIAQNEGVGWHEQLGGGVGKQVRVSGSIKVGKHG